MDNNKMLIELRNGDFLRLKMSAIDEEIDLDRFLSIDMSNISAELVTISAVLNKFGLLLADANEKLAEKKLQLEIIEAKTKEKIRNEANNPEEDEDYDIKAKKIPTKKLTNDEVDMKLVLNKGYQAAKTGHIKAQKEVDYINSIYWSLKDKSGKLDKLSMSITTGDVLEQLVNSKLKRMNFVDMSVVKSKIA
jgi:hypothetical protein